MPSLSLCQSNATVNLPSLPWRYDTNSNHTDPLHRITPAKLITTQEYDREKYLDMLLDSAEAVLSIFEFNRSLFGFDAKKSRHWLDQIYQQRERDIETARTEL